MTFGPYGVGRVDGKSVMVPDSVVGDLLDVTIQSEHGGYAIGLIARVVVPGAARRLPPCVFLPRCGGCDWQHIEYHEQVRLKAQTVVHEFRHALGVDLDAATLVEPAPSEFAYRSRVRSEEHTSELQSLRHLVCRLLLEKKKKKRETLNTVTTHK